VLGICYSVIVMRRAHRQSEYRPVFEDWLWHTILPPLAYSAVFVAGTLLGRNSADALFVIGAAALLLVFIGIHNAWDTVTYVTMRRGIGEQEAEIPTGAGADPRAGGAADVPHGTEASRDSGGPGSSVPSGVAAESPATRTPDTLT
jgi:hypothetical protein